MAVNLTNLIDLDGLRAFKSKNDEVRAAARAAAITAAQTNHDRHFVDYGRSNPPEPGMILVSGPSDAISGTGTFDDPYIVDFTVVYVNEDGTEPKYYKTTSSAESSASIASTSDIEGLFS